MANQAPKIEITKESIGLIAAVITLIGAVIGLVSVLADRPPSGIPTPTAPGDFSTPQLPNASPGSPEALEYIEGEVLFEDDFEDGRADGWIRDFGWSVIEDGTGNLVLQGIGAQDSGTYRNIKAGENHWDNYALEAETRVVEFGSPQWGEGILFRFRRDFRVDGDFYSLDLNSTFVQIQRADDWNFTLLQQTAGFELPMDEGFTTRVEVTDDFIRGYVNGVLVAEAELSTPYYDAGGVGITVPPTNIVWIDNVRVVKLVPTQ